MKTRKTFLPLVLSISLVLTSGCSSTGSRKVKDGLIATGMILAIPVLIGAAAYADAKIPAATYRHDMKIGNRNYRMRSDVYSNRRTSEMLSALTGTPLTTRVVDIDTEVNRR